MNKEIKYVATINTPGYLPQDDDPPVFDTAQEAWEYLAQERRDAEDEQAELESQPYSLTVDVLDAQASAKFHGASAVGAAYGSTPGYDGDHDLGLIYSVSVAEAD